MARKPNANANATKPAAVADAPSNITTLPRIRRNTKPAADANANATKPADAPKPARKRKPAAATAPIADAPKPITAADNNGRAPAFVRRLVAGASINDAKKLRDKLRGMFGGRGTWQAYDNGAHEPLLREALTTASAVRRRDIAKLVIAAEAARNAKPADPKPARKRKPAAATA